MKKCLIFLYVLFSFCPSVYAATGSGEIILPKEINWTERFILTELKELRVDLESQKREMYKEIQNREIQAIDKALSYNANTVNFFFIFMTVIIAGVGMVGWKTLSDIKRTTRESMERETSKIIDDFQKKIEDLEKEQKVNILWRQFNALESDKERLEVLDRITRHKPDSIYAKIARAEIYLEMRLYNEVIEITTEIIEAETLKYLNQSYFLRASAYAALGEKESAIADLYYVLQVAPDYKDLVVESEYFTSIRRITKIKELLK